MGSAEVSAEIKNEGDRSRSACAGSRERHQKWLPGRETMDRRQTLKLIGGAAAMAGFPRLAFAQAQKEMVTVVKIAGIPWFNAVEKGIQKGAQGFRHQRHDGRPGQRRSGPAGQAARGPDRQEGQRDRPRAARREGAASRCSSAPRRPASRSSPMRARSRKAATGTSS